MCEWQVNKIIREQRMTNSEEVLGIFYELFEFFHAKTTRVELQEYMLSGVLTATQKTTPLQKNDGKENVKVSSGQKLNEIRF